MISSAVKVKLSMQIPTKKEYITTLEKPVSCSLSATIVLGQAMLQEKKEKNQSINALLFSRLERNWVHRRNINTQAET